MEHQHLIGTPTAGETRRQRARMVELLEAITPADQARDVLARRINAKMALAELLTRATFGAEPKQAARAAARVELHIAACNSLLLG